MLGSYTLGPNGAEENGIYCGDAMELGKAIPDESVDLIVTDPVYWETEHYRWLAHLAERVLVPGGSVIAQCGALYQFEAGNAMRESTLTAMPVLAEVFGGAHARSWAFRVYFLWKPHLWFVRGKAHERAGRFLPTTLHSRRPDKEHHKWGDPPALFFSWIRALSPPGGVVLDPFTGSASVPAACVMLQRRYLAFEIDPDTTEMARRRVRMTNPPLPLSEEPLQTELFHNDN